MSGLPLLPGVYRLHAGVYRRDGRTLHRKSWGETAQGWPPPELSLRRLNGLPEVYRAIPTARQTAHRSGMAVERDALLAGLRIPEPDDPVISRRGDRLAVR